MSNDPFAFIGSNYPQQTQNNQNNPQNQQNIGSSYYSSNPSPSNYNQQVVNQQMYPSAGQINYSHPQTQHSNTNHISLTKSQTQKRHAVATFGPGGMLITAFPFVANRFEIVNGKSVPRTLNLSRISISKVQVNLVVNDIFNGPLISSFTRKKGAVLDLLKKIKDGQCNQDSDYLWKLLILLVENDGVLLDEKNDANNWLTVKKIIDYMPVVNSNSTALETIQALLIQGNALGACDYAQAINLWSHALIIASFIDAETYSNTLSAFLEYEFTPGMKYQGMEVKEHENLIPLQVIYNLFGNGPNDSLLQVLNTGQSWDWKVVLSIILANPTANNLTAICSIGDELGKMGLMTAAHFCYLLCFTHSAVNELDLSRLFLVSSDHINQPCFFKNYEAIQMTELLEYAKSLNGSTIPHFQAYKFAFAMEMADLGNTDLAAEYLLAIQSILSDYKGILGDKYKVLSEVVDEVCDRQSVHLNNEASNGKKHVGWFTKGLDSFMSAAVGETIDEAKKKLRKYSRSNMDNSDSGSVSSMARIASAPEVDVDMKQQISSSSRSESLAYYGRNSLDPNSGADVYTHSSAISNYEATFIHSGTDRLSNNPNYEQIQGLNARNNQPSLNSNYEQNQDFNPINKQPSLNSNYGPNQGFNAMNNQSSLNSNNGPNQDFSARNNQPSLNSNYGQNQGFNAMNNQPTLNSNYEENQGLHAMNKQPSLNSTYGQNQGLNSRNNQPSLNSNYGQNQDFNARNNQPSLNSNYGQNQDFNARNNQPSLSSNYEQNQGLNASLNNSHAPAINNNLVQNNLSVYQPYNATLNQEIPLKKKITGSSYDHANLNSGQPSFGFTSSQETVKVMPQESHQNRSFSSITNGGNVSQNAGGYMPMPSAHQITNNSYSFDSGKALDDTPRQQDIERKEFDAGPLNVPSRAVPDGAIADASMKADSKITPLPVPNPEKNEEKKIKASKQNAAPASKSLVDSLWGSLSLFGKSSKESSSEPSGPIKAKLGQELNCFFDEATGKWVFPDAPQTSEAAAPLPPPPQTKAPPPTQNNSAATSRQPSPAPSGAASPAPLSSTPKPTYIGALGGSSRANRRTARSKYVDVLNPTAHGDNVQHSFDFTPVNNFGPAEPKIMKPMFQPNTSYSASYGEQGSVDEKDVPEPASKSPKVSQKASNVSTTPVPSQVRPGVSSPQNPRVRSNPPNSMRPQIMNRNVQNGQRSPAPGRPAPGSPAPGRPAPVRPAGMNRSTQPGGTPSSSGRPGINSIGNPQTNRGKYGRFADTPGAQAMANNPSTYAGNRMASPNIRPGVARPHRPMNASSSKVPDDI